MPRPAGTRGGPRRARPGTSSRRSAPRTLARIAFLGSPAVAAATLRALHGAGHNVVLVVTGPDRRRSRGAAPSPNPVKQAAHELALPVTETVADVVGSGSELGVVVAFGRLVRAEVLDRLPMVNVHFSLLPRWRGAAPVERALLAGDEHTGVSIMALEAGLDTGPVYATLTTTIDPEETAAELTDRLGEMGTDLLLELLRGGVASLPEPVPQTGEATYASKLTPEDLRLDWSAGAGACRRLVRVGRAWTTFRGERLVVHRARAAPAPGAGAPAPPAPGTLRGSVAVTADGGLELLEVQGAGRSAQPFAEWARGARPLPDEVLGA
ncbi:MAG TPA: methionyl-tRNA formyltransferase [Acidimicrobiales bacterium]|nr:methionyl-tRNA formyltransferase [Acidimicrobiales bacterium]